MSSSLSASRCSSSRLELQLQRPIGHPPSLLEQLDDLVEHRIEVHHRPSTCASAASAWGSQKVMSMARYSSMAVDSSARACSPLADLGIQRAEAEVAVGQERAHAEFLGQGEGLLVVGFGLRDIGGIGMGMDDAKLVQRLRLVARVLVLPGQVERLARVLPGLLAASRQTTDLAEPCDPAGMTSQRARADIFADRLLQQRAPLREAPLERRGIAQARHDLSQPGPVAGGTTEGQALLQHPDGVLQVPLGEVQEAEAAVGNDRCGPSAFQRGEAERLLPVAPALGEGPERAQGPRQPRPGLDPSKSVLGVPDSLSAASTFRRSSSAARPKSPMA